MTDVTALTSRAYDRLCHSQSWEEIWEAGPYYERVSELLEEANHYAIFSGWQIDSRLPLSTPWGSSETLREKVLRLCESRPELQIYFLIWDHSYLYIPERELWQGRVWDSLHPNVHFVFDNRHAFGGAHHEKICVFDGKVALCGGIDLCDDRWDSPEHLYTDPRRSLTLDADRHGPYHDLAVQVNGSACIELQRHLRARWEAISTIPFPQTPRWPKSSHASGSLQEPGHAVYVSRTRSGPAGLGQSETLIRETEFLFRDLIQSAQKSLVFEGQYFWSKRIADELVAKMISLRGSDFELVLILAELSRIRSITRKMAPYEMSLLSQLIETAEATGTRLTLGSPYTYPGDPSCGLEPKPIYIHSKLMIVDDRYLCVGSANLASRAQRIDTEVTLTYEARATSERRHVASVRRRVLAHWGLRGLRDASQNHVRIKPFQPTVELRSRRETWPSYSRIFDPDVPVGYLLKRKLRIFLKHHPRVGIPALVGAVWLIASIVLTAIFGTSALIPWAVIFASTWFLPIPPILLAAVAAQWIGAHSAQNLLIGAIWIASLIGYLGGRTLSQEFTALASFVPGWREPEAQHHEIKKYLGRRSLASTLLMLADPRIEFRLKTTALGAYFIPFPWVMLASGILWPAVCSLVMMLLVRS